MHNKHKFSIYYAHTTDYFTRENNEHIILEDKNIYSRLISVLRAKLGDIFVLFDRQTHVSVLLKEIKNKTCAVQVITKTYNTLLTPEVVVWIPVLKKDDLEEAVYEVVAAGATAIQLVVTKKTHKNWYTDKELIRLERIMIAAAEQSTCYRFAALHKPLPLQELIMSTSIDSKQRYGIFADPLGKPLFDVMTDVRHHHPEEIIIFAGPEGDLTSEEKEYLQLRSFVFCVLTPTVLRSKQVLSLLTAVVRSTAS